MLHVWCGIGYGCAQVRSASIRLGWQRRQSIERDTYQTNAIACKKQLSKQALTAHKTCILGAEHGAITHSRQIRQGKSKASTTKHDIKAMNTVQKRGAG